MKKFGTIYGIDQPFRTALKHQQEKRYYFHKRRLCGLGSGGGGKRSEIQMASPLSITTKPIKWVAYFFALFIVPAHICQKGRRRYLRKW